MAFGTGTHESTQLCLEVLETLPLTGRSVLDIGTGSGILAIASAKLGAATCPGLRYRSGGHPGGPGQLFPQSGDRRIRLFTGEVEALSDRGYDVILANLEGKLIREKLADFGQRLNPQGHLVLSGLLQPDAADLCRSASVQALPLALLQDLAKGEWRCLVFSTKTHGTA